MKTIITLLLVAFSLVGLQAQDNTVLCTNPNHKTEIGDFLTRSNYVIQIVESDIFLQVAKYEKSMDGDWIFRKSDLISLSNYTELQEYCINESKRLEIKAKIKSNVAKL
jgi:hypothetical protein